MHAGDVVQYAASGLTLGSIYALIALSLTIIYNTTGVVNFAQGQFVMIAGLIAATLYEHSVPMYAIALCTIASTGLLGAVVYGATVAPIKRQTTFAGMLVSLGVAIVLTNIAQLSWGTEAKVLAPITDGPAFHLWGATITRQAIWIVVVTAVLMVLLFVFFHGTTPGQQMLACAETAEGAAIVGVNVSLVKIGAYILAGLLAGVAGFLITPTTSALFSTGITFTLTGFAAAALGGFGSPIGAVVGGVTLGLLESYGGAVFSTGYQDLIALVALVLVLMLRPGGMVGTRALA